MVERVPHPQKMILAYFNIKRKQLLYCVVLDVLENKTIP